MEPLEQNTICSTEYLDYPLREGTVINTIYVRLEDLEHEKEVVRELEDRMNVNTVQSKAEIVSSMGQIMGTMNSMILIMILGTGVLTFAMIYNITNTNIFGRRHEIVTLSVLGFTTGEPRGLVFYENFFLSAFGVLVGLLPRKLLTQAVLNMSATEAIWFPAVLNPSSYFITVLLVGIFILTANLLLRGKVRDIDTVESLKGAE